MQTPTKSANPVAPADSMTPPSDNPTPMTPPPKSPGSVFGDLFDGLKTTAGKIAERYIPPDAIISAIERGEGTLEAAARKLSPEQHAQFVGALERILAVVKRGGPGGAGRTRRRVSRRSHRTKRR